MVSDTIKQVGMVYCEPGVPKRAFETSHTTVFVYDTNQQIGFGRTTSDGTTKLLSMIIRRM